MLNTLIQFHYLDGPSFKMIKALTWLGWGLTSKASIISFYTYFYYSARRPPWIFQVKYLMYIGECNGIYDRGTRGNTS